VPYTHLSTPAPARPLADRVAARVADAKRNSQVLMLGLGPYLDGITASAAGSQFDLSLSGLNARRRSTTSWRVWVR